MFFSPQQDKALVAVDEWLTSSDQQLFRLFGFAGTGKTTLAKHLAQNISGDVLFAAYTGKAAHVLRNKGCPNAGTIHGLIYRPMDKSQEHLDKLLLEEATYLKTRPRKDDPELARLLRDIKAEEENLKRPSFHLNLDSRLRAASLLIIDECSMVNTQMAMDLLGFGTKILVLGDPAQLPPVAGGGYFTEARPDVMLTEIHRQAEGNPIIALATMVRQEKRPKLGSYGDSQVIRGFNDAQLVGADQILTGRNATRKAINRKTRGLLGRGGSTPVVDDRVVCLRNNHELGLMNGALWKVLEAKDVKKAPLVVELRLQSDDGPAQVSTYAHRQYFQDGEPPQHLMGMADHFDFGYALTCHKSQGSQWDHVLVIDESSCFRESRWRWLYTAITRAAERVDLVLT